MAASAAKEKKVKIIASACGSGVNFVLGITKVLCGVYTNSIAIISDGVNNFGDVFSSAGAAVGFSLEGKKRSNFPSGLGRTEYAAELLMALIIIAVGAVFAWQASDRFFYHPVVTFSWVQFGIIAATAAVKAGMAAGYAAVYRRYPSGVIKALVIDSILDACITLFTLVGLFLARYISFPADAAVGLAVSIIMIVQGIKLLFDAMYKLLGGRDERRERGLERLALDQKGVKGVRIRLYDCGAKRAEAYMRLDFEEWAGQEEILAAEETIKAVAEKYGIFVTYARIEEEI